ncbi:MAG TPA: adenosylcobalamin-dependent ribonucleoside-diphosphate reductase [Phycisphaerales bacterium]|nr:adenosylcobalamin-dependent ribonucleoside-diphosphate reductase [Phycisphaerales bacterium]
MRIVRKFTVAGQSPFDTVAWTRRSSKITNPDGSVVFQMDDAEVPATWSQLATDIMVSKYFRKAGVPEDGGPNGIGVVAEQGKDGEGVEKETKSGSPHPALSQRERERSKGKTGPEKSARQVIHRLAGCWRHWGEEHGYFDSAADAQAFYDELVYMMVHQVAAPNSPQWFNTGLNWAYGITGPAQGHYYADPESGEIRESKDAYSHPQPHACFIQSVDDDLVNSGGIMDLWVREARLFKYGSGTGTNFSKLRGENEPLSGGGKSSGLMSWLRIGDRAAGAIKSGGTTRRAAKMVCLDMDHPDIEQFVNWKVREEIKVQALVEGLKAIKDKKSSGADTETIGQVAEKLNLKLDYDFNGESYYTVSGQNSNNSVRVADEFFDVLDSDGDWQLKWRIAKGKDGSGVAKTVKARDLWNQIGYAAWRCADPGVQFDSTINAWHTCPKSGRINASNPCSEYMFLDNTACNLASINLLKLYDSEKRVFDVERYEHAIDLWTIVLEISVLMAAFPSREIARLSYRYRTLGLGYANIGAMLMQAGIPYDSEESRTVCGAMSAIMTGRSYRMSAEMAKEHGPFPGFTRNREEMLRVIRNHRRAAHGVSRDSSEYESLRITPVPIDHRVFKSGRINMANSGAILDRAARTWDEALALGERHGYRNAQTTVIAPTGTIGLLMDCDTTGVEPDFALVKFKKLAGGGYFKIANASLKPALVALGYSDSQVREILTYVLGTLSLDVAMPAAESSDGRVDLKLTLGQWLKEAGLVDADLRRITDALPGVFEIGFAFSAWTLGDDALTRLGIDVAAAKANPSFNLLKHLGLNPAQIEVLNERVCGTQTVEGAPHLKAEHLAVFDCANKCGRKGVRFIAPEGHIRMMAAAQPFISGAISKTINLPHEANVEDIKQAYRLSWELGLKANALYRDGCKLSQPLSTKSEDASADAQLLSDEDDDGVEAAREEVAVEVCCVAGAAGECDCVEAEVSVERIVHRPMRRRLPDTRRSLTHKFNVAGHEGYLTVGLYEDGQPGELFITMAKEGSTIGGVMDSLGTATSVALQYGVPIESLVKKFTHQRFEPAGMTTNRDIPFAKSLVDYIFRWMGMEFIPGYRAANAPRRAEDEETEELAAATRGESASRAASLDDTQTLVGRGIRTEAERGGGTAEAKPRVNLGDVKLERSAVSPEGSGGGAKTTKRGTPGSAGAGAKAAGAVVASALSVAMLDCQGDAPSCEVCGTITVRNGACYKCLNCGHSMGCS